MPGIGLVFEGREIERILDRLVSTNEVTVVGRDDTEREVTVDELKRLLRRWSEDQFLVNEEAGHYAIIPLAPLLSGDPKPGEKCITVDEGTLLFARFREIFQLRIPRRLPKVGEGESGSDTGERTHDPARPRGAADVESSPARNDEREMAVGGSSTQSYVAWIFLISLTSAVVGSVIVAQFAGTGCGIASFLMISIITVIVTSPGDGFVESFMALLIIGIILGVLGWNLQPRTEVHSLFVGLYVSLVLSKISFALIVERK